MIIGEFCEIRNPDFQKNAEITYIIDPLQRMKFEFSRTFFQYPFSKNNENGA